MCVYVCKSVIEWVITSISCVYNLCVLQTELLVFRPMLGDRGCVTRQLSVCLPVSIHRTKQKCFWSTSAVLYCILQAWRWWWSWKALLSCVKLTRSVSCASALAAVPPATGASPASPAMSSRQVIISRLRCMHGVQRCGLLLQIRATTNLEYSGISLNVENSGNSLQLPGKIVTK